MGTGEVDGTGVGELLLEELLMAINKEETLMGESVAGCTGEDGKGPGEFELYGRVGLVLVEESWGSSGACRPT